MKVAISSTGNDLDAAVDPRFGRASYIVIADSESGTIDSVIDNRDAQGLAHGAGINTASRVAEAGVSLVLTGRVGPKAAAVLQAAGIKEISGVAGTVKDALLRSAGEESPPVTPPSQKQGMGGGGRGMGGGGRGMGGGGRGMGGGGRGMGGGGRCMPQGPGAGQGRRQGQGKQSQSDPSSEE